MQKYLKRISKKQGVPSCKKWCGIKYEIIWIIKIIFFIIKNKLVKPSNANSHGKKCTKSGISNKSTYTVPNKYINNNNSSAIIIIIK